MDFHKGLLLPASRIQGPDCRAYRRAATLDRPIQAAKRCFADLTQPGLPLNPFVELSVIKEDDEQVTRMRTVGPVDPMHYFGQSLAGKGIEKEDDVSIVGHRK